MTKKTPSTRNPLAGSRVSGTQRTQVIPDKKKQRRHPKHKGKDESED